MTGAGRPSTVAPPTAASVPAPVAAQQHDRAVLAVAVHDRAVQPQVAVGPADQPVHLARDEEAGRREADVERLATALDREQQPVRVGSLCAAIAIEPWKPAGSRRANACTGSGPSSSSRRSSTGMTLASVVIPGLVDRQVQGLPQGEVVVDVTVEHGGREAAAAVGRVALSTGCALASLIRPTLAHRVCASTVTRAQGRASIACS